MPKNNPPTRVSMSVPITLSITDFTKKQIGSSKAVALVTQLGETVAILRDPEVYANRKEEIVSRMFGVIDPGHPYISHIYSGGPYLLGGEVELLDRIRYNDGLDEWRKTTTELEEEVRWRGGACMVTLYCSDLTLSCRFLLVAVQSQGSGRSVRVPDQEPHARGARVPYEERGGGPQEEGV